MYAAWGHTDPITDEDAHKHTHSLRVGSGLCCESLYVAAGGELIHCLTFTNSKRGPAAAGARLASSSVMAGAVRDDGRATCA
jgi:hypothetical protein